MSRILFLIVTFGVVLVAYFAITNYQKTYKILPANLPKEVPVVDFEDWHEFNATSGRFSVLLPVLPQNAKEKIADRQYDMYVSEKKNGTIFMISQIDFGKPVNPDRTDIILNAIMEDLLASNPENELKSSSMGTFESEKALNFKIENKEIVMDGKAFMKGNTLFVLTRISKLNNQDEEEYKFFIHSFHLLEPSEKK